jgi:hypothetical protein
MKMVQLTDGCWVASDQIAEVKINDYADRICVRTKDGIGHSCAADYGKSVHATAARLIAEINAAEAP